jgi:ribonuclease T1
MKATMAGRWWILLAALSVAALWWYVQSNPLNSVPVSTDPAAVTTVAHLPDEAQDTLRLIARGGPYPYRQDGSVFANRERLLPDRRRGYWHEFTVRTPGADDRGPRRLIVGRDGEVFYTADHYASFRRVINAEIP